MNIYEGRATLSNSVYCSLLSTCKQSHEETIAHIKQVLEDVNNGINPPTCGCKSVENPCPTLERLFAKVKQEDAIILQMRNGLKQGTIRLGQDAFVN